MDNADKNALATLFAVSHGAKKSVDSQELDNLIRDGMIDGKHQLTSKGRSSIRVILAGGVFDIIHPGHIHTLNEAKALGDVLMVVVATEKTAQKMKKRIPLHSAEQRRDLVSSLKMVNACVIGSEKDIFETVKTISPDIIALGYDQIHQERVILDGCKQIGLHANVARLQSPVPHLSSSDIEKRYGESIHGI